MLSTRYDEQFASTDGSQNTSEELKAWFGYHFDDVVVFALVAVAVFYIAAASCWFIL